MSDYYGYTVCSSSLNNLPIPEGQYLAPFLVEDWDTVKAMDLNRDNLETWHFSGIPVLVAFTPVTAEQFLGTVKLFWSDVRRYIANLHGDPNVISYDKMLEDMMARRRRRLRSSSDRVF